MQRAKSGLDSPSTTSRGSVLSNWEGHLGNPGSYQSILWKGLNPLGALEQGTSSMRPHRNDDRSYHRLFADSLIATLGRDSVRTPFQARGAFLMTPFRPLLIAAAAALAVAACSFLPPAPKTSVPPPSPALGRDLPAATAGSAYGVANTGGAFPHGAIRKGDSDVAQEPTAETTEEIVLMGLDGTVKITPSTTSERYREDADSCYAYARGEVAHDARIEIDVNAAFENEAGGLGLAALRRRMSNFERTRRVPSLFNTCMVAKGYSRQ